MNKEIDTYCGLSCKECTFKDEFNCGGCLATEGKPFHGVCEIAECAREKKILFCGECNEFPCEIITRYSYDEEHGDNGLRLERCKFLLKEK